MVDTTPPVVDTTPPLDIIDLSAVAGNTRGTINLSWTAPGDDESIGTTTQYIVRYATSSAITTDNWASSTDITSEPTPSIASSTEGLIIGDLTPSETYYWAIKSEDDAGNISGLSNCASTSPSAIAENIVISEVSVQNTNCTTDDFIELYNPTDSDIYLGDYQESYLHLVKRTKTGTLDTSIKSWRGDLKAKIPAHGFYLWANSGYTGINIMPDATTTAIISANNGIALRLGLKDTGLIIDSLGWGDYQNKFVEKNAAMALLRGQSLERKALATSTAELLAVNNAHHWEGNSQDSNNNSQDFVLQTIPNPQNSFSLTEPETVFPVLANTAWPMLQGDVRHSGLSVYIGTATGTPTSTPKLGWPVDLGSGNPTSPIIGLNGEIYIGTGINLYKINTVDITKELFYSTRNGETIQTPVVSSDGTVYISDNSHYLYALSPEGQLKWKYNILDGSSPTIASDGVIYIGSSDGFHAINSNGERIWKTKLGNYGDLRAPAINSINETIYTVDKESETLYALNINNGDIKWSRRTNDQNMAFNFNTAPSITNDGTILVGSYISGYSKGLYAINSSDGTRKWYAQIGNINGSIPTIGSNGIIYVGNYDYCLHAVDLAGNSQWGYNTANMGGKISASPIIDAAGTIYIGSTSGMFYALNPVDGSVKWQAELDSAVNSSAVIGVDGTIYIASYNGTLYAFGG